MSIKVIVTGATGFLGFNLAKKLKSMGFKVVGLGRNIKKGELLKESGIEFIPIDLQEEETLNAIFKEAKYVFHCAAKSSDWGSYQSFYNTNVISTRNVCNACMLNKIERLIYISTPSIYFDYKDKFDIKESDSIPKKFVNNYAKTKYLAEKIVDDAENNGLNVITIRPRAILGIGDTSIIPRIINVNQKKFLPKTVKDDILIDVTFVDNVVESLILAMNAPTEYSGRKYNITNGENIKFYETIEKLVTELGMKYNSKYISYKKAYTVASIMEFLYKFLPNKKPILTKYSVALISFNQTLDILKAKEELGYKPIVSIDEGFKQIITFYKENNRV